MNLAGIADPKIALCLSGGGFRATYFHLGVIAALRERGLLEKVTDIFSVSGGSIAAAHLVKEWALYTGDDADFKKAEAHLRALAARNLRGRVVRRWILSCLFVVPRLCGITRGFLLRREYGWLLGHGPLVDCYRPKPGGKVPPDLHLLSTNFSTGDLCRFSKAGFAMENDEQPDLPWDILPLTYAVAASSAFPPLFPPMQLDREMIGASEIDFRNTVYLSDGGVFDNLGYESFSMLRQAGKALANVVVISNASGAFNFDLRNRFSFIVARNVRATEIMMQRVAGQTLSAARTAAGVAVVDVNIATTVREPLGLSDTVQRQIQHIRTDLDRFSKSEIDLLAGHGSRVCRKRLDEEGVPPARSALAPDAAAPDTRALSEIARRAASRTWGFFNATDWTSYALSAIIVVFASSILSLPFAYAWLAKTHVENVALNTRVETLASEKTAADTTLAYQDQKLETARKSVAAGQAAAGPGAGADANSASAIATGTAPQPFRLPRPDAPVSMSVAASRQAPARIDFDQAQLQANAFPPPPLSRAIAPPPPAVDPASLKVWIQFAGSFKREDMIAFGRKIEAGWPLAQGAALGGERTPSATGYNEVRYGPPANKAAAEKLATDVFATGIVAMAPVTRQDAIIPKDSLEIWISK